MKKNKTTIIIVLFFFIGLGILFYPSLSNYYNQKKQSKAIVDYNYILNNIQKKIIQNIMKKQKNTTKNYYQ